MLNKGNWVHRTPAQQKIILSVLCIKITSVLHVYSFTCSFYNKVVIKLTTTPAGKTEGIFNQAPLGKGI